MNCNLCLSNDCELLIDFGDFSISHHYLKTKNQISELYPFRTCICKNCNHVFITDPILPEVLYKNYVTLSGWKYQPHISHLLKLIQSFMPEKKAKIVEVGSNDGEFLKSLSEFGYTNIVGVEPTDDAFNSAQEKGVKTIHSFFNQNAVDQYINTYGKCDCLIMRQVLEHIPDLILFGSFMKQILSPNALVVIEVPDFSLQVDYADYTFWEEHVNYFTHETLSRFAAQVGIEELHHERFLFSGLGQIMIARYNPKKIVQKTNTNSDLGTQILSYGRSWEKFKLEVNIYFEKIAEDGLKVALYGAGARSAAFVNFTGIKNYIDFVADDQVEKQNLFLPDSNLAVLPSDYLQTRNIDVCLLGVNTENEDRVIDKHFDRLKKGILFYSILPPSNRLLPFWNNLVNRQKIKKYQVYF